MPKMKTRKAAAKRYRVSANGKVRFKKQGLRHILTKKSRSCKRNLKKPCYMHEAEAKKVETMMPYAFK